MAELYRRFKRGWLLWYGFFGWLLHSNETCLNLNDVYKTDVKPIFYLFSGKSQSEVGFTSSRVYCTHTCIYTDIMSTYSTILYNHMNNKFNRLYNIEIAFLYLITNTYRSVMVSKSLNVSP